MKQLFYRTCLFLFCSFAIHFTHAQKAEPVVWQFHAEPAQGDRITLYVHALLAPGWHLYSQFLNEGGPVPTRFYFDKLDGLVPIGKTRERGEAVTFYDSTYEMEITWYTGEAFFEQDLSLHRNATTISGHVEFMVCNDEMCVPAVEEFEVER